MNAVPETILMVILQAKTGVITEDDVRIVEKLIQNRIASLKWEREDIKKKNESKIEQKISQGQPSLPVVGKLL